MAKSTTRQALASLEGDVMDLAAWGTILELLQERACRDSSAEEQHAHVFAAYATTAAIAKLQKRYFEQMVNADAQ